MRDVLMNRWQEIGDKIVALAQEFPADKYDARVVPEARTFAEQLRHVAFWNNYVKETLAGKQANGDANELPKDAYPTKTKIVTALEKSFAEVKSTLAKSNGKRETENGETMISFIEHNGEHYGQLVVYFRLNGLVPPASR